MTAHPPTLREAVNGIFASIPAKWIEAAGPAGSVHVPVARLRALRDAADALRAPPEGGESHRPSPGCDAATVERCARVCDALSDAADLKSDESTYWNGAACQLKNAAAALRALLPASKGA